MGATEGLAIYYAKRAISLAIVVFLLATAVFSVFFVMTPQISLPKTGQPELQRDLIADLKLNEPIPTQYVNFIVKAFTMDFISWSVWKGASTSEGVSQATINSALLLALVLVPVFLLGLVFGPKASGALENRPLARVARLFSLAAVSIPVVSLTMLIYYLYVSAGAAAVPSHSSPLLPWLASFPIALGSYVLLQKGKQRHFGTIEERHEAAVKSPASPSSTAKLLVSWTAMVTLSSEIITGYQGLGDLLWASASRRDVPLLMLVLLWTGILVAAAIFVLALLSPLVKRVLSKPRPAFVPFIVPNVAQQMPPVEERPRPAMLSPLGVLSMAVLLGFIVMALLAPQLATVRDPYSFANREPNVLPDQLNPLPPSLAHSRYTGFVHPFGTDHTGTDLYSAILYGAAGPLAVVGILLSVVAVAGIGFWAVAAYAARLRGVPAFVTGGAASVLSDFAFAMPVLTAGLAISLVVGSELAYLAALLILAPALTWACMFSVLRAKIDRVRNSAPLDVVVGSLSTTLYFGKFIVILMFLGLFVFEFVSVLGIPPSLSLDWSELALRAYDSSAMLSGAWWWILFPLLVTMLFIGGTYKFLDTLERALRQRFGTL